MSQRSRRLFENGKPMNGGLATLDMLPDVVNAVNGKAPVLFDSGIRCAADVFKAISLGARAVLIGRPYCWALAAAGERGIRDLLCNFVGEFDLTLALSGSQAAVIFMRMLFG
jgi:lactate 2-monooxygenase